MILFTEDMLNIILPTAKKYHTLVPVVLVSGSVEYRIVAINSSFIDFESNGSLVSAEVGGELLLENNTSLKYTIKNGIAELTELAKAELLANSF
ncbi:hypothetical protein [Vibrio aestuarianus]|uniref:hypothetical protein n=1 Tax=Vibrio aestuarianus TaxID=28171 RepID=UPI0021C4A101|nr:hypothetical protein [Vibrio aestuarianus]MDE1211852.1 hypothetical protein [Vibrio aestuarianus]MDE1255077.1 hypothetical protein [Vibrio aestuarianus]MDE1319843.1 hypothetical protein [Vibrio aestuarianus]CAH8191700.1 conserved hypothetical protein [Vibrio aestuarianus]